MSKFGFTPSFGVARIFKYRALAAVAPKRSGIVKGPSALFEDTGDLFYGQAFFQVDAD
jgi:hypothetical protein